MEFQGERCEFSSIMLFDGQGSVFDHCYDFLGTFREESLVTTKNGFWFRVEEDHDALSQIKQRRFRGDPLEDKKDFLFIVITDENNKEDTKEESRGRIEGDEINGL